MFCFLWDRNVGWIICTFWVRGLSQSCIVGLLLYRINVRLTPSSASSCIVILLVLLAILPCCLKWPWPVSAEILQVKAGPQPSEQFRDFGIFQTKYWALPKKSWSYCESVYPGLCCSRNMELKLTVLILGIMFALFAHHIAGFLLTISPYHIFECSQTYHQILVNKSRTWLSSCPTSCLYTPSLASVDWSNRPCFSCTTIVLQRSFEAWLRIRSTIPPSDRWRAKQSEARTKSIPRKPSRGSGHNQNPSYTYRKNREMCSFWPPWNIGSSSDKLRTRYEFLVLAEAHCELLLMEAFADKLIFPYLRRKVRLCSF